MGDEQGQSQQGPESPQPVQVKKGQHVIRDNVELRDDILHCLAVHMRPKDVVEFVKEKHHLILTVGAIWRYVRTPKWALVLDKMKEDEGKKSPEGWAKYKRFRVERLQEMYEDLNDKIKAGTVEDLNQALKVMKEMRGLLSDMRAETTPRTPFVQLNVDQRKQQAIIPMGALQGMQDMIEGAKPKEIAATVVDSTGGDNGARDGAKPGGV